MNSLKRERDESVCRLYIVECLFQIVILCKIQVMQA